MNWKDTPESIRELHLFVRAQRRRWRKCWRVTDRQKKSDRQLSKHFTNMAERMAWNRKRRK